MEKIITFCGQQAKVVCDEKCHKAWGIQDRPKIQLSEDPDDYAYLADDELPEAPVFTGNETGDEDKPVYKESIPNKWCVNECERCEISEPGKYNEPLTLRDFSKRRYNQPSKHKQD